LSTLLPPDVFQDVADFHRRVIAQAPSESPSLISQKFVFERFRFMQEELDEFVTAAFDGDMVGAADGLTDLVYVAVGTMYLMGLPFNDIWNAVQSANMRKVRGMTKRGNAFDAAKPEGWVGPEAEIAVAIGESIK
jgi:predicted HAD superfamily Cof-like phosphohydrolase